MKHQARALRVLAFFVCAPVCAPNVHQGQIPGLFIMKIKPCKCFAGLTACNTLNLTGIVFAIRPRARRHVAASRFACFARHWGVEASRFGAKRGSRCCELSRNEGLRYLLLRAWASQHRFYCVSRSAFGPWLLTPHGAWLSGARAAVALAMPGLALPGAGRSCSRRAEPGFSGRRQQFLAPHRAWLPGHAPQLP